MGPINLKRIYDLYNYIKKTKVKDLGNGNWWVELVKKAVKVKEIREMFGIKKSYLVGSLMFVLGGLLTAGIITREQFEAIMAVLGGAGIMTVRAAIAKNGTGN